MEKNRKYTVVIADDHPLTRAGLCQKLEGLGIYIVIGEADNGKTALELVLKLSPDLLLLDIEMPILSGIEVAKQLFQAKSDTKTLVLSAYDKREFVYGVLNSGVHGYMRKDEASTSILSQAVSSILGHGDVWTSPATSLKLVKQLIQENQALDLLESLTSREHEVLVEVGKGLGNVQIAEKLFISVATSKNHVEKVKKKIGIRSRNELIAWAWEKKLIEVQ